MAQVWKVVEFEDKGAAVVPGSWLEEAGDSANCFWPPSSTYDHFKVQRAIVNHLPPNPTWNLHGGVRVLVTCASYMKAKEYLNKAVQSDCATSDIQSATEDNRKRTRRANPRYLNNTFTVQTTRGRGPVPSIGSDTDEDEPRPRQIKRPRLSQGPDNCDWLLGPSTTQRDSPETEHLPQDLQPTQDILRDIGISKVVHLLSEVLEENKNMREDIKKLGNELRALRREVGAGAASEASPPAIKLPLTTTEDFVRAEALMKEPTEKKRMISTLALVGGLTAEVAVRRMLQGCLTNQLASKFNWAGKGLKESFKNAILSDVLFAALQKTHPGSTMAVYEGTVKKWLKYAPDRDGGAARRQEPAEATWKQWEKRELYRTGSFKKVLTNNLVRQLNWLGVNGKRTLSKQKLCAIKICTRWLPHTSHALEVLMRNYKPRLVHFENHTSDPSDKEASAAMKGRSKLIMTSLKQYSTLLFIHLMLDLLQELKHLSLLFQKDGLTLQMVSDGLKTSCIVFVAMQTNPGPRLQRFLVEVGTGSTWQGVDINRTKADEENFNNLKLRLTNRFCEFASDRFSSLETGVLKAISTLFDLSNWPKDSNALATFGTPELNIIMEHFRPVLEPCKDFTSEEAAKREWLDLKILVSCHYRHLHS
ncbi:hypothetical protein ACEWY4_016795 [Coilia grayii]|uniref:DUF4806 domain-containing protein n=1 Tax=Coilia grayii TaxID=363190 RepID=A0ABD1JLH3_9TELE